MKIPLHEQRLFCIVKAYFIFKEKVIDVFVNLYRTFSKVFYTAPKRVLLLLQAWVIIIAEPFLVVYITLFEKLYGTMYNTFSINLKNAFMMQNIVNPLYPMLIFQLLTL